MPRTTIYPYCEYPKEADKQYIVWVYLSCEGLFESDNFDTLEEAIQHAREKESGADDKWVYDRINGVAIYLD